MNIELEKKQIINEIMQVHDEWLLKAIKKLLDLDYEEGIDEEHKVILNERITAYEINPSNALDWEEVKQELLKKTA